MKAQGKTIICVKCDREGKLRARGLCGQCYSAESFESNKRPCVKCGKTKRILSRGRCSRCTSKAKHDRDKKGWNERVRERRKRNPEPFRKLDRERSKRPSRILYAAKQKKRYYSEHKSNAYKAGRKYMSKHPGLPAHYAASYRARKAGLPCTLTVDEWNVILAEHNYRCTYCGSQPEVLHREHRIPVSKGGGYTKENIVPSCKRCNVRKHVMTDTEFREYFKMNP